MATESISKSKTLLGYELSPHQNAIVNYLVPSLSGCFLYKFIIAADISVIFRHYKDDDPIWAALTLFFMYLPVIGSYIIIISDWDYWPEPDKGTTKANFKWFIRQTLEHVFFPVWNMWRFAEKIFWSIEAVRNKDTESINKAILMASAPRIIELYVFLQAYLHALPQILLQLHILVRHNSDIVQESKTSQVISIFFNLTKLAVTTTYYQRFKTQKLTGSQYPWLKEKKLLKFTNTTKSNPVVLRNFPRSRIEPPEPLERRRRSSDLYLQPDPVSELAVNNEHQLHHQSAAVNLTEVDFNLSRVIYIKGLQENDLAGKITAFLWWFTFLLGRVLAISIFAYFFMKACIWLLTSHVLFIIAILLYDVRYDNVKRDKTIFFIFIGMVYIFCLIEFKIKFKKANFIYYGYFVLIYLENFLMCTIWYMNKLETIANDYWIRYIFYIIVATGILSFSSMVFYLILTKPKSVSIPTTIINKDVT